MNPWNSCKNLLLIRLDNMGDVIMNNAAFAEIRAYFPNCKLTLLTSSMAAPITTYLGTVDEVLIYDLPWLKEEESNLQHDILSLVERLKTLNFDGCIIFSVYSQNSLPTALLAYMAQIPLRAAYSRENPYHLLTHWLPDTEPLTQINHQITRDLSLLKVMGIYPDLDRRPCLKSVNQKQHRISTVYKEVSSNPYILVNMDVSETKRRFDEKEARRLISLLLATGKRLLFIGKEKSNYLNNCGGNITHPLFTDLVGKTALSDLLYLIEKAEAIITVNTGVAHIACAYTRPVIVLYANTNPQHTPWSTNSTYLCYDIPADLKSKNQIIRYVDHTQGGAMYPIPSAELIYYHFGLLLRKYLSE